MAKQPGHPDQVLKPKLVGFSTEERKVAPEIKRGYTTSIPSNKMKSGSRDDSSTEKKRTAEPTTAVHEDLTDCLYITAGEVQEFVKYRVYNHSELNTIAHIKGKAVCQNHVLYDEPLDTILVKEEFGSFFGSLLVMVLNYGFTLYRQITFGQFYGVIFLYALGMAATLLAKSNHEQWCIDELQLEDYYQWRYPIIAWLLTIGVVCYLSFCVFINILHMISFKIRPIIQAIMDGSKSWGWIVKDWCVKFIHALPTKVRAIHKRRVGWTNGALDNRMPDAMNLESYMSYLPVDEVIVSFDYGHGCFTFHHEESIYICPVLSRWLLQKFHTPERMYASGRVQLQSLLVRLSLPLQYPSLAYNSYLAAYWLVNAKVGMNLWAESVLPLNVRDPTS